MSPKLPASALSDKEKLPALKSAKRPPLGPLNGEEKSRDGKKAFSKRDHVIENKLRLLKENMIRSGNADIANIADKVDFSGDEEVRTSKDSRHKDLRDI